MNKSQFFVFATLLLTCLSIKASIVEETEAAHIAQQFFSNKTLRFAKGYAPRFQLVKVAKDQNGNPDYYIYNRGDNAGYVIVTGDNDLLPVVAYSEVGKYISDSIPPHMQWYLDELQHEIHFLKDNPEYSRHATGYSSAVRPLLSTMWGQSEPYNKNCPTYVLNYKTYNCATGCVATAMAQIMKHHQWPKRGTGSHSYVVKTLGTAEQTLSADFGATQYNWDILDDIYSGDNNSYQSINEVARLMSHCGISIDMAYGLSSGAVSTNVAQALYTYFGYDRSARLHSRHDYSIAQWENMIRTELDNNRPVYYSGITSEGGHAFVCDGYDHEGYFHFNWGWDGRCDGYFMLTMLNPNDNELNTYPNGFNSTQQIITHIMPDQGTPFANPLTESAVCAIRISTPSVTLGRKVSVTVNHASIVGEKDWNTMSWGIIATPADINSQEIVDGVATTYDASSIKLGAFYSSYIAYYPSASLPNGKYFLRMAYLKDSTLMQLFKGTSPSDYVIEMEIKNGKAYFSKHYETSNLVMTGLTHSDAYTKQQMTVSTQVTNNSETDYFDYIYFALKSNNKEVQVSDPLLVSLPAGATKCVSTILTPTIAAGNYTLVAENNSKEVKIAEAITVNDGGGTPALAIASNVAPRSTTMPADEIRASATISNTGGVFAGYLELLIYNRNNTYLTNIPSSFVTIQPGATATVEFNGTFGGIVGDTYYMAIKNPTVSNAIVAWDATVPFVVGEAHHPCDVNGDDVVDIDDVNIVVECILNGTSVNRADVNDDGTISVDDISLVIDFLTGN